MEKIVIHKVYNLVNPNGDKLQLKLGWIKELSRNGWRWAFEGKKIPMPVRSRTWFNGFPEPVMLEWLKENDWVVRTIVSPCDGSADVFDLPKAEEENTKYFVTYFEPMFGKGSILCDNIEEAREQKADLINDMHCPISEKFIQIYRAMEIIE